MRDEHSPITHLNFKLLQTFALVATNRSFRRAAELTHRSQSAVTTQIQQLESQLGVTLFHRTTRSVRLTAEGEELFTGAQRALQEVSLSLRKVQETVDVRRGKVALACSPSVAGTRLPAILARFEQDYPEVSVTLRELPAEVNDAVLRGTVDFGVGPVVGGQAELHFEPVLDDALMALVPKKFMRKPRTSITLAELTALPLLLQSNATAMQQIVLAAMQTRGLQYKTKYECIHARTLVAMAEAGLGAAILPRSVVRTARAPSTRTLKIVEPAMARQIAIITVRGRSLSPAASRLAQLVREMIDTGPLVSR